MADLMKIIISPAKKMREQSDWMEGTSAPAFEQDADKLRLLLKGYDKSKLKKLFAANDKITEQNYIRFQEMDLKRAVTPALLSYVGLQYQSMAPEVFTEKQWEYVSDHLRILSGFYGILKAKDRIVPYRLEMQAKLSVEEYGDLYGFWGRRLFDELTEQDSEIVNLASKEYSKVVEPYLTKAVRMVNCIFGELSADDQKKVKVKATAAKIARGDMVRWMAEHGIQNIGEIPYYDGLGYGFRADLSDKNNFVFVSRKNT